MWLFSRLGFFSAVCPIEHGAADPTKVMVRARQLEHLQNLKLHFKLEEPIITKHDADYRYRMILPKSTWVSILASLGEGIDYHNFKDEIWQTMGHCSYERALHDVWARMSRIEPSGESNA